MSTPSPEPPPASPPAPAAAPAPSTTRPRKPEWLRVRAPGGPRYSHIKQMVSGLGLHTVCEEAHCPNIGECWGEGTATLMLMGDTCTRGCRFCAVKTAKRPPALDPREPESVASAAQNMGLDYVVLTMVDRDDLPDGGAQHVARTITLLRERMPALLVEVLSSDFRGDEECVRTVLVSQPHVFAQNQETVERLTRRVRDAKCSYATTLRVLEAARRLAPHRVYTKSSLMVGLGETRAELLQAMRDLRGAGVELLTLGQYLQPTADHLPVERMVHPDEFAELADAGRELGFLYVASGPLVRSSYRAGEAFLRGVIERQPAQARPSLWTVRC